MNVFQKHYMKVVAFLLLRCAGSFCCRVFPLARFRGVV